MLIKKMYILFVCFFVPSQFHLILAISLYCQYCAVISFWNCDCIYDIGRQVICTIIKIALREKYNFSQSDIARQIGVTPALISAYENQERKPSLDKLVALADIFHVSTDYILGRSGKIDSSVMVNVDGLSDKQIEIIRNIISEFKSDSFLTKKK